MWYDVKLRRTPSYWVDFQRQSVVTCLFSYSEDMSISGVHSEREMTGSRNSVMAFSALVEAFIKPHTPSSLTFSPLLRRSAFRYCH